MMARINVAAVCAITVASNPEQNLQTLTRWIEKAACANVDLAVFPEMYVTGLATESMYEAGLVSKEILVSIHGFFNFKWQCKFVQ